jgi:hypothetical protein
MSPAIAYCGPIYLVAAVLLLVGFCLLRRPSLALPGGESSLPFGSG